MIIISCDYGEVQASERVFTFTFTSYIFTFTFTCSCQNCGQCDDREEQACEKMASHTYNYDTVHGDLDKDHDDEDDVNDGDDDVQDGHNDHEDCDDNCLSRHCSSLYFSFDIICFLLKSCLDRNRSV